MATGSTATGVQAQAAQTQPTSQATSDNNDQYAIVHGYSATADSNTIQWIIDSSASHHLSGNKESFRDLKPFENPIPVRIVDGSCRNAIATGTIHFHLDSDILLTVEALYVPDFGVSLLSISKLIKAGF